MRTRTPEQKAAVALYCREYRARQKAERIAKWADYNRQYAERMAAEKAACDAWEADYQERKAIRDAEREASPPVSVAELLAMNKAL